MKTHEQFADDLALYALEELTGSERQEFEQHLETCASCRREVQALRGDLSLLALSGAGPRPPARSKDRLMRAIAAEPRGVSAPAPAPVRRAWLGLGIDSCRRGVGSAGCGGHAVEQEPGLAAQPREHRRSCTRAPVAQLQQAEERLRLLSAPDAVQVSLSPQAEPRKPHATAIYSPSQTPPDADGQQPRACTRRQGV